MPTFDPSSREAEAHAEMIATRIGSGVVALLFCGFVATLLCGPLLEAGALARGESALFAPLPAAGVERGVRAPLVRAQQLIAELDARFDERSALVALVRAPAQRLLVRSLDQGNERALVGRDGWLFFADDVAHLVERAPGDDFFGDPERAIVAFREALAARGIALLVVPVPVKPAIHPERIGSLRTPEIAAPVRRAGEAELLARLAARGVALLDLAPRFARDAALAPLYLARDTHWRPEAVEIAATEIAIRLRELVELTPGTPFPDSEPGRAIEGSGDLVALLGLEPEAFARETVELEPAAPPATSPGTNAPVLLLGDSFAAIYSANELGWGAGAGLSERLAARLGLPVDALVQNAGGASATRERLARELAADPARLDGVRAVVWIFAARELSRGEWHEVALPAPAAAP